MTEWLIDVIPKVMQFLNEYGYRPTVRGMFYRLVSEEIISNTFEQYKGLIQALGTARKKRPGERGYISPFAFADDSRYIEDINDRFTSYQDVIDEYTDWLKDAGKNYINDGFLPKWYRQPNYVEVMLEKEALRGAFKSIFPPDYVRIVPNKGWDSIPYRMDNIRRMCEWKKGANTGDIPKTVYVLYFGDYDPTGTTMSYVIEQWLSQYGIKLVRMALNREHISTYGLDHLRNPDPKVKEKLEDDPNKDRFKRENDGELFQIELDAMQKSPQQFKELVLNSVSHYYNENIHKKNLKEFAPRKIDAYVKMKVNFREGDME
jgi:hypothetical protein